MKISHIISKATFPALFSVLIIIVAFSSDASFLALTLSCIVSLVFVFLASLHSLKLERAKYNKRLGDGNAPLYDVYINGVKGGVISDSDYASIEMDASLSLRNTLNQLLNGIKVFVRLLNLTLVMVPVMFFWIVVSIVLLSDQDYNSVIDEISTTLNLSLILNFIVSIMLLWGGVVFFLGFMCGLSKFRFGYVNCLEMDVNRRVRVLLNIPYDGNVVLRQKGTLSCKTVG